MYPSPGDLYSGDGLSGFREVLILDYTTPDVVYFSPTSEGWGQFFLTYSLETPIFLKVYTPCTSQPEGNSSSKTGSPFLQRCYSRVAKSFKAALAKIAGR